MLPLGRPRHGDGVGRRSLPRLSLFWQWLVVFLATVALRVRRGNTSVPLGEVRVAVKTQVELPITRVLPYVPSPLRRGTGPPCDCHGRWRSCM